MDTNQLRHMYLLSHEAIRAAVAAVSLAQINGKRVVEHEIHEDIVPDESDAYTEVTYTMQDGSKVTLAFRREW